MTNDQAALGALIVFLILVWGYRNELKSAARSLGEMVGIYRD